jgi:hypothetical protein
VTADAVRPCGGIHERGLGPCGHQAAVRRPVTRIKPHSPCRRTTPRGCATLAALAGGGNDILVAAAVESASSRGPLVVRARPRAVRVAFCAFNVVPPVPPPLYMAGDLLVSIERCKHAMGLPWASMAAGRTRRRDLGLSRGPGRADCWRSTRGRAECENYDGYMFVGREHR